MSLKSHLQPDFLKCFLQSSCNLRPSQMFLFKKCRKKIFKTILMRWQWKYQTSSKCISKAICSFSSLLPNPPGLEEKVRNHTLSVFYNNKTVEVKQHIFSRASFSVGLGCSGLHPQQKDMRNVMVFAYHGIRFMYPPLLFLFLQLNLEKIQ